MSVQIANLALVPAVKADPTATVVATGTSCRHQIRDLTGRAALHPLEVLAGRHARIPFLSGSSGSTISVASAVTNAVPVMLGITHARFAGRFDPPLEDAAGDALLPPHLARLQLAVREQARQLRARAGAARRAVVGLARAEHEVAAMVRRVDRRAEQLDVIHRRPGTPRSPPAGSARSRRSAARRCRCASSSRCSFTRKNQLPPQAMSPVTRP